MLPERRRKAFPLAFLGRVAIAWLFVGALLIGINWNAIAAQSFPDSDDVMRLLQVRDLIGGQSWFDVTQTRVDTPSGGVNMHWSRLVDIPLILVILALTPFLGSAGAEAAALVIVPLITLGLVMMLAARIAWRLLGDEEATLTSLVLAISIPVLFQLGPLRIDHHGWQIVCALAAMNGLMARSPKLGGVLIGASLAIWLNISIEGLPLAVLILALLALRWLRDRAAGVWLVGAIQSLALFSAGLFALTRGITQIVPYCDALSQVHLAMFAWAAITLTLFARFEPAPRAIIAFGFVIAGGGALALLLLNAPQCVSGAGLATPHPVVSRYGLANAFEGMPIWHQSLAAALQYAITPVIGLLSAIHLIGKSRGWLREYWTHYAIILAGAFAVSIFISRAGALACALAAPPLAWQLRHWLRAIRSMDRPAPRLAAMTGVACALLPALPIMLFTSALPAKAGQSGPADASNMPVDCRIQDAAASLAKLPTGEVFAPLDIAPELLLVSNHTIVATGHHRGATARRDLIETSLGTVSDAQRVLSHRGTSYVALCPESGEARLYARIAPEGFVGRLADGYAPDWLEPVELDQAGALRVWQIRPE